VRVHVIRFRKADATSPYQQQQQQQQQILYLIKNSTFVDK